MHLVASKPLFLSKALVSAEAFESGCAILRSQVLFIHCLNCAVSYTFLRFAVFIWPLSDMAYVIRVDSMLVP